MGFVHNGALIDNIEKTVVRAPLVLPFSTPLPYFPRHKNAVGLLDALSNYEIAPTFSNLIKVTLQALKG